MISTKDIPTGGSGSISKVIEPGNRLITINKIYLDTAPWSNTGYNLMLDCEGPELGDTFEGFNIDNDESKGKHKGQVARIRASRWLYEDKLLDNKTEIKRDLEIIKILKFLCDATKCSEWFEAADGKHKTIEDFIKQLNKDKPFANKFISTCIAGKQYESKDGYINNDLFFPKFSRNGIPFESEDVEETASRVYKFNEKDHIIPLKPKTVDGFEGTGTASSTGTEDFELG